MRENVTTKAARLLAHGRVVVEQAHGRYVRGIVRGDSGTFYPVVHEDGAWSCPCDCRQLCSHIRAMQTVTAPVRPNT